MIISLDLFIHCLEKQKPVEYLRECGAVQGRFLVSLLDYSMLVALVYEKLHFIRRVFV